MRRFQVLLCIRIKPYLAMYGSASGSYTFNRETAKEYVEDNLDLLHESCEELGVESNTIGEWFMNQDYESMDVTIRCCLLSECIHTVVAELTN